MTNGVQGIGRPDSKVALYEEDDGERGLICVQPVASGEAVLRVPLRLAITDAVDDPDLLAALPNKGRLWQDRLASKLLKLVADGPASPWHPYIQALPQRVPSALDAFPDVEGAVDAVEYPPAVVRLSDHRVVIAAKWREIIDRCPDAIGGADLEEYRWAHTCVMSRTFGNAAPGGGIGLRMMVPLVDMLNHAGDRTASLLSGEAFASDNVRWDVLSPDNPSNGTGEWEMAVSAKRDIEEGEPLLLSYFEGSNDEFLLHYGFVPPCNPHDEVELAPNLQAALEDLWAHDIAAAVAATRGDTGRGGGGSGEGADFDRLFAEYRRALAAGQEALHQEVEEALQRSGGGGSSSQVDDLISSLEVVKVASGSRISNSLVAALEALTGGDMGRVEFLVAALCWLRLRSMSTPLLDDLSALLLDALETGADGGSVAEAAAVQVLHYSALLSGTEQNGGVSAPGQAAGVGEAAALARRLLQRSGDGGGGGTALSAAAPLLPYERRLAVAYRSCKKMQLVDIMAAVAASLQLPLLELEGQLQAWASRGGSGGSSRSRSIPPPWRSAIDTAV